MNKCVAAGAEPAGLGQPCQLIKCLGGTWHSGSAVSMLHVISPNHLYCRFLTIFFKLVHLKNLNMFHLIHFQVMVLM